ncbi:MAG: CCA tRNA nucleotidyltransferase [Gemmatimonadales bacterium]|nr:MAG: CCA tRNA nucleotidyltransferase [Gemmatimonadales bacterium]
MMDLNPPGPVPWICRTLERAGFETWAVGGAVRDGLAGRRTGDWDLTTAAPPGEIRKLFRRTVPIGIEHGTVGVLARDGTLYEVTTFRRDVETSGRHAVVSFAETLDEDLARRDFTINAVAWHPLRRHVHDPYGGVDDLRRGRLRTVGDPRERFAEDYLRILRALRFAGVFSLQVDPATWRALVEAVPRMGVLSPERVREELEKILSGDERPSASLSLYAASGVLAFLYPELDSLVGLSLGSKGGSPGRRMDAWSRSLLAVDAIPRARWSLRLTALLSRLGLPTGSAGAGEEGLPAPERGRRRAAALLKRLRSSNARIARVADAVEWVVQPPPHDAPDQTLRRWLAGAGRERLSDIGHVWIAESRVGGGPRQERLLILIRRLRRISASDTPLSVGELAFSGRDLIRMGYRPGRYFGDLLEALLDLVLEDPARNRRETLEAEARRWIERCGIDAKNGINAREQGHGAR